MPKAASSSAHAHHRQVSLPSDQDADSPVYSPEDTSAQAPSSPRSTALARKRKNADAQAAFRARRANYIANLEETVTSLENAVRRLQDALRDARDEGTELKADNTRLIALLDNAGIDHRRQSGANLLPPTSAAASTQNSPNPTADFAMAFGTTGPAGPNPDPIDAFSAYYTPSPGTTAQIPSDYMAAAQAAAAARANFDMSGIPRPASAASGTSSHSSAHSFHGAFDGSSDMEPTLSSGATGGPGTPGLMGLDGLNLYGSSPWNPALLGVGASPASQQQQQQQSGEQETDLGRSDTVKASDPRHAHRRAHSHLDMTNAASPSSLPSTSGQEPSLAPGAGASGEPPQQQQDMYGQLVDDSGLVGGGYDFDPYSAAALAQGHRNSRPGSSASSLFSNEGNLGHQIQQFAQQQNLSHSHLPQQQQQQQPQLVHHHSQPHLHPGINRHASQELLDDGSYYSSEGDFNEMDFLEGMDMDSGAPGGMVMADSLMVPSHMAGGSASPFEGGPGGEMYGVNMLGTSPGAGPSSYGGGSSMLPPSLHPSMIPGGSPGMPMNPQLSAALHAQAQQAHAARQAADPSQTQVPMSSTLAAIKAQAFGTSRKSRTRAKRPGADSAAKAALEALQARAQGLGLDVDLAADAEGSSSGGASVQRSGATVKRSSRGRASGAGAGGGGEEG